MKNLIKNQECSYSWLTDTLFLAIAIACLFFIQLGVRALFSPDEGRYAEIAREMVTRSDFVTPYLNGIKYFEKPALFYWLAAGAIKLGGINLWAVRSVNALLALFATLATYVTGRLVYGRLTGILSALILATSLLYFVMAHMVSLDLPVTVFIAGTLYSFLLANRHPAARRWLMWLAAIMAACALLTKGLIGIVFPGLIIGAWMLLTSEWRQLGKYYLPSAIIIFLIVALPWHLLVGYRNPEFFYFYFIEQQFLRYATMNIGHYQPAWYFIPCLILGFFPWIVFLPQACSFQMRDQRNTFFLLWAGIIFIFFSFSKSKLIPYILPIFPALALLTGHYLAAICEHKKKGTLMLNFILLSVFTLLIGLALYWFLNTTRVPHIHTARALFALAVASMLGSSLIAAFIYRTPKRALAVMLTGTFAFLLFIYSAVPAVETRNIQPLAATIKPHLTASDDVITYNRYYQELPFYLERRITILNWRNEMTEGMKFQDTHQWMINDQTFWKRWHSKQRLYVFIGLDDLAKLRKNKPTLKVYIVDKTLTNAVISNQPAP